MGKPIDLTGQKFNRLTVQELAGKNKHHQIMWNCLCDCGSIKKVCAGDLKSGNTQSCGCYGKEQVRKRFTTHGQTKSRVRTRAFKCWGDMLQRCNNSNNKNYKNYGGRGIKVCLRWLESFENFYEDMGDVPDGMTLDRKDNDGDYCKENCHWSTHGEQCLNTRRNRWIEFQGERKTITQWERHLGMGNGTLAHRLNKWSVEDALTRPIIR
jgi:hypothetical protein